MAFDPNKARRSLGGGFQVTQGGFSVPDKRGDGFDYQNFGVFVENNEGRRSSVYKDTEDIPTIGVGFNMTRQDARQRIEEVGGDYEALINGQAELTDQQIDTLRDRDLRTAVDDARALIPRFDELSTERQRGLADMAFNMGRERLGGFTNMLQAIENNDWDAVQREAKDSKWFGQVGRRGPAVLDLLSQGDNVGVIRHDEKDVPGAFDPAKARAAVPATLANRQLEQHYGQNADVAAEANALSKATGIDGQEIARRPELRDNIKKQLAKTVAKEALAFSPATARMMARGNFASQAHDDIGALTQVEAAAQGLMTEPDRARGVGQMVSNALRRGGIRVSAGVNQAFGEDEAEEALDTGRTWREILDDEMTWGTTKEGRVVKSWMPGVDQIVNATSRYLQSRMTTREEALANAQERLEKVGELNERMASIPKTAQSQRFMSGLDQTEGFADAIALVRDNPIDALVFGLETAMESAPQLGAGVGAGLVGGPVAGVAVTGLASGATERYATPAEFFRSQGIDMGNPDDVARLLGNPELLAEGARRGSVRGSIIGAADALSFRLASLGFGSTLATIAGQTVTQTGLAGGGEALAGLATEGVVDHKAVVAEMLGEVALGGPVEAISQGAFRGDMNRAVEARRTRERIEEIRERLLETKLAERNPQAAAEHFSEAMPEPKEAFIPIEAIDAYIHGTGRNRQDVYNELDILEEAKDAHDYADDVRISGETLGRIMLDEDMHTALAEHIRRTPDAMTDFEATQFEEDLVAEFDQAFAEEQAQLEAAVTPAEPTAEVEAEPAAPVRGATIEEDLALFRMEAAQAAGDQETADLFQVAAAEIREGNEDMIRAVDDFVGAEGADLVRAQDRLNELVIQSPHKAVQEAQDAIIEAEAPSDPDLQPASSDVSLARDELGLQELFRSGQEAGMTPKAYESYLRAVAEAADGVQKRQERKLLKKRERQVSEQIAKERETVREQMRESVQAEPVYAALNGIGQERLDRAALLEVMPEGFELGDLPKVNGRNIYTNQREKGMHPNAYAEMYGFPGGDTMAFAMMDALPEAEVIEQRTDAEMARRHPDLMEEARQIDEAIESLHDDRTSAVLAMEMNALRGAREEGRLSRQLIQAEVNRRMGNTKISDIRVDRLLAAERKNGKLAGRLLRQGDRAGAAQAKFRQLVNYEMAKKAFEARRTVERQRKFMQKFNKEGKKFPTLHADYVDAIKQLLGQYDLGPKLTQRKFNRLLTEWKEAREQSDGAILTMPERLWRAENQVNWQDMTLDEFETLYLGVKNIEAQARAVEKMIVRGQEVNKEDAKAEMFEASATLTETSRTRENRDTLDPGTMSRIKAGAAVRDAALVKMEFMVQRLDNFARGGPWHKYLYQPMAESQRRQSELSEKVSIPLTTILRKMPKEMRKNLGKTIRVDALDRTMKRSQLIMVALNSGNASNLGKMIRGSEQDGGATPWTEEGVREAVGLLTKEEGDFVQKVWDTLEGMHPEVERIYRAEFGVSPPKLQPTEIMIGGEVRSGGYFPMKYRHDQTTNLPDNALDAMQQPQTRASVYAGFTEARTGFAAPVDLNIDNLGGSIHETVHYVSYYEAVRDVGKLLRDQEVKSEVQAKLGPEYYDQMTEWLRAIATDGSTETRLKGWDDAFTWLRANFTAAVMVASYTTLLSQSFGLTSSIGQLGLGPGGKFSNREGVKWMAKGMLQYARAPLASRRMVMELSDEMRFRVKNFDRDVNDTLAQMGLATRKGKVRSLFEAQQRMGLMVIGQMQLGSVDIPTWLGAYNQALAQNKTTADAVKIADQVVRTSQGSGSLKDQSAIQRKRGLMRALTMFSTYTLTLYNMQKQSFGAAGRDMKNVMGQAARMAWLVAIPAMLDAFMRDEWPDDRDDIDPELFAIMKTLGFSLSSIPVAGKGIDSAMQGYGVTLTPIESIPPQIISALKKIEDAIEDGEMDSEAARAIFLATGSTLGIGGTFQINRVWKALEQDDDPTLNDFLIGPKDER